MNKFLIFVFFFCLLIFPQNIIASESVSQNTFITTDITINNIASVNFKTATFNNLVLDAVVPSRSSNDFLTAITFQQKQPARYFYDLINLRLWTDLQEVGFQGYGIDHEVGALNWNSDCNCYYVKDLNESIPSAGLRLFVSVEIPRGATDGQKIQFSLPALNDLNKDGVFNVGETGIFTSQKNNGPTDDNISNLSLQKIVQATRDIIAPLAVITNLTMNQTLTEKSYVISGIAKDQGGSNVKEVKLGINGVYYNVISTGDNYELWEYQWKDFSEGDYIFTLQAEDYIYNSAIGSRNLAVSVAFPVSLSTEKSNVVVSAKENINDFAITVLDTNGNPYIGATASVVKESGIDYDLTADKGLISDSFGNISLRLTATTSGISKVKINVSDNLGNNFLLGTYDLTFTVNEEPVISAGELFKLKGFSSVYWALDGVRHYIPSEAVFSSWGFDWADVKEYPAYPTIGQTLGKSLKFRDGALIKGTEAAVFLVTNSGKRTWITSEEVFLSLGYKWSNINWISDAEISEYQYLSEWTDKNKHPNGTIISYKNSENQKYLLENGQKRLFSAVDFLTKSGYRLDRVISILSAEIYSDGTLIDSPLPVYFD